MEPQQSDAHADDGVDPHSAKPNDVESQQAPFVEFDAQQFAALLKNPLMAYSFSWDPLMKALETLAASMARQQHTQKDNNNAMDEMREQVEALRERLDRSDQQKQDLATTVAQLQDQVGTLSTELQAAKLDQDAQRDEIQKLKEVEATAPSPPPVVVAEDSVNPAYASTEDLQTVKRALSTQLRQSMSAVFGDQFVVHDGDDDDDASPSTILTSDVSTEKIAMREGEGNGSAGGGTEGEEGGSLSRSPSQVGTGVSGVLRTPLPGVPFASEAIVNAELAKLRALQAALEAKLAKHNAAMDSIDDKLGSMDARLDAAATLQQRRNSTPMVTSGPSTEALQRQIDDLKDQQNSLLKQLQDHAQAADKQASGLKELVATLDDLAMQQKMLSAQPVSSGDDTSKAGGADTTGPPQMDLSLVFSKIADLRRATDASIDQIQQNVRDAADATTAQQTQLDALRHAALFNEHQKLRLMEARLALQKELLDRNQTNQERTKPQLTEWKKQLEQLEEKLVQGFCDQDAMDEMEQLQRNYHRTMLTMTPLLNAPPMIAESLQTLADEVKDVYSGTQSGVLAVVLSSVRGEKTPRGGVSVDDFTTKLRYMDEEIAATQQVNVVTEKKNDPLLKSLDTMRDKLESLWSLWHQNLIKKKRADGASSSTTTTPRTDVAAVTAGVSADALRDIELRLMGAVRRISSLEEDVDRFGALVSSQQQDAGGTNRTSVDDMAKLRKDMQAELHRLSTALAGLQLQTATPLVPTAPPARSPNASSSPGRNGDLVGDLHSQMVKRSGKDIDGRFYEDGDDASNGHGANAQRTTYDALLKDLTKKVTQAVMQLAEKSGGLRLNGGGPAGINANPNVNFRALLENFTQKFDDRLDDTREFTIDELAKLRKELLDLLKGRLETALRDLRAEFMMIYYPTNAAGELTGDSTAVGTKPMMCVACSRPVPVSGAIRDGATYPSAEMIAEQSNAMLHAELEYDRNDDDFVYRAGFKMPADRKSMTLPFLANNIRSRIALNKIDRKPRRPARQHPQGNPVDNIVREAMDLDRKQRQLLGHPPSPPK